MNERWSERLSVQKARLMVLIWVVMLIVMAALLYLTLGHRLFADPVFYLGGAMFAIAAGLFWVFILLNKQHNLLAQTDGLTGVYNHRYFMKTLDESLEKAKKHGQALSIIMVDINDFKVCNDVLGHMQGDSLLRSIARVIQDQTRGQDVVARYGGDEFAVLIGVSKPKLAPVVARRIKRAVASFPFSGRASMPGGRVTVSVGIACYPEDADESSRLIHIADNRMYSDKTEPRPSLENLPLGSNDSAEAIYCRLGLIERILDEKDGYTPAHNARVANYTRVIAEAMGIVDEELLLAASMHDYGKLEIPRELLTKREPLTDIEWDIIKRHQAIGAAIAREIGLSDDIVRAIYYHHERVDGGGYPEGLKGEEIPLWSRIIAVPDSFDAMVTNRGYRTPLSIDEAIQEIKKNAGSLYDYEVVEAFLRVMKDPRIGVETSRSGG